MGFRIHRGIWQFQKSDGTYESKYRINSEGTLVETDTDGNEAGNFVTTPDWSNITGKPTNLSSFANDLGNYGGWLTTSGKAADANLLDGIDSSAFVRSNANDTISGRLDFTAVESIRLYGIRGQFTNEYIHLYNKVGIGHPNGWGQGEGNTPAYGLSTYGGMNIAYGNGASSTINGYLRINQAWAGGDYGAEQLTIRGTYPSIALRSITHNSKWLIHNDNNLSFYYGSASDDNSWARKFQIPTDGNIWMSWANDYISNLLDSKQAASTAINTGNIGSQSVNYATTAGNADTVDGYHASSFAIRQDGARYSTDFNNILSSGFYNAEGTPPNAPGQYGQLIVAKGIDTAFQIYGGYSNNALWFRGQGYGPEANGFYPWRRVWHDGDFSSTNVANWNNAYNWGNHASQGYITAYGAQGANGNFYIDDNYGNSVVGVYSSTRYQGVWAMGDAYKLAANGTSTGSLYGIAWTHQNIGGESVSGLGHQMLIMSNGDTRSAIGDGIWTKYNISTTSYGSADQWATAYGWGNHASAGYQAASTAITTSNIGSQSVNYANSAGAVAWSNVSGKPTNLSSFTNDLGNYGGWITASHLGDYSNGGYRVIADYGGNTTWYIRGNGQFIWANGHDWTQSFRLSLSHNSTDNGSWAYFGQQDSNNANGRYRGVSIRKYAGGNVEGDITAAGYYIGGVLKSTNWDTAYNWGNHASAGYQSASTAITTSNIGSQSVSNADTVDSLHASSFLRSDSTNSLFRTTAGNGLGLRFWDSDNYKIWMSSTSDGTWGGRLDSTSDYNMYFKMSGGTNRGFAFKNSTTTVAQIDGSGVIYTALNGNSSQWDSAYRWGNHASAGYLTRATQLYSPNSGVVAADAAMPSAGQSFIHTLGLGPSNNDGHILGMTWTGTTVYGAQIFIDTDPNDIMAIRSRSNAGAWTSWKTVIHSGTIGSQSVNYANSAGAVSWSNVSGKPSTFSPSSHTHGIGSVTDASRWWNNFGDNHSTRTSFDAAGGALSTGFGWRYVQGSGNSPGWGNTGNNQYYALTVGLGNDYDYNIYGMQMAIPRQGVTPYLSVRFEENRVLGAWQKISAGYADSAGSVAWSNVSGKPSTFSPSSHTHDDRYYTESEVNTLLAGKQAAGTYLTSLPTHDHSSISGTAQGLSIRGYGTDSFSFEQTSSTFAGWGGWANHFIGNHGNGATYYNTIHTMPFWGPPRYSRLEGGAQTESLQYWTEENFDPGSKASLNGSLGTDFYANKMFSDNWFRAKGACGLYFEDYGYGLWSAYSGGATYGNVSTYSTGRNGWSGYSVGNWISMMAIDTRRGLFLTSEDRWLIKWDNSEAFSDYEIMMGSDGRNKSNVQALTNSLDKVLSLRGVSYNYKNQEKTSIGFIAQEVKEVIPEVVSLDSEGYYAVGYQNLVAVLAEAIKEQQAQIDELKQIINNLTK